MSTYETLDKAKQLFQEYIDDHIEELIKLENGTVAVFTICKELGLDLMTDRMLVEMVQQVYTQSVLEYDQKRKRKRGTSIKNMKEHEKDNYIRNLEGQMDFMSAINTRMTQAAEKHIKKLQKENEELRSKEKNTGFFARLFAKILGRDVVRILQEKEDGKNRQDKRLPS